jgi:amino acid transporter
MSYSDKEDQNGLAKSSLGFKYLLAESIALVAPIGAALGTLLGSAQFALGAFPLAVLVAMLVTIFWVNTPYQFSKKIAGRAASITTVRKPSGQATESWLDGFTS